MVEADRDKMLREMAANRGCRLVKSRRRTPGAGDYGRYGLKDAATGKEVFGFGANGLVAAPEEIETFLRKGLVADWKSSLAVAADVPSRKHAGKTRARADPSEDAPARPKGMPHLRLVDTPPAPAPRKAAPPQAPPRPVEPPRARQAILRIREARPADAERLARLLAIEPKTAARRISGLRKAGEPPLVAEEGDAIVGCVAWHAMTLLQDSAPLGRITLLLVAPGVRRRGIGRALVEEAEARLADSGCARIEAPAEIELAAAPDFFRRLGWTRSAYLYARTPASHDKATD